MGGAQPPVKFGEKPEHFSRRCCVCACACVHRQIGFVHMSLGIERERESRLFVFCVFLRYESGESPQFSDDLCYDSFVVNTFTKLCVLVIVLRRHNIDKAGDGWYQNAVKTKAQQEQREP